MKQDRKDYLLRGIDEYYRNRKDIIAEAGNGQEIETIDGLPGLT